MDSSFDQLTKWIETWYGLPGVVLTLAVAIGTGYFLKMIAVFPNRLIPLVVVPTAILWNVLLRQPPVAGMPVWQHYCRLVAVGFLIGLVACVLYDKVLKPLEAKFPWLKSLLEPASTFKDEP